MKVAITLLLIVFSIAAHSQNKVTSKKSDNMNEQRIIQTIKSVFQSADDRNWKNIEALFADNVLLDYVSLNGGVPQQLTNKEVAANWAAFLPGFDRTKHTISDFEVKEGNNKAFVKFNGKGEHFLGNDEWNVTGVFEEELIKIGDQWKITKQKFNLNKQTGNLQLPEKAKAIMKDKTVRKIQFNSEGLVLKGHLHLPVYFDETKTYKGIIVTGSWLTVKEQMPDLYAAKLAIQGYVALTFDFRNYGESQGEPRNYEVPDFKSTDIFNAVNYLKTVSFIDKENIGGLAICASSGYMSQAVVKGAGIKAINFVAPWLHNAELVNELYGGKEAVAQKIKEAEAAKAVFEKNGKSKEVTAASKTDETAAMPGDFPYYLDEKRGAIKEWDNKMAVMSWKPWLEFDAVALAKKVSTPVQIVHSKKAATPKGVEKFYSDLEAEKNIIWMADEPTQFDFYDQEPYTSLAVKDAEKWFQKHLQ